MQTNEPGDMGGNGAVEAEQPAEIESTSTPEYKHDKRFEDAAAGRKKLNEGFDLWTKLLADRSLHASYAVIAGAWAIFGTADKLFGNTWAMMAVLVAVLYVGLALVINFLVVFLYRLQLNYARKDPKRWQEEWATSEDPESDWPWTAGLERVSMPYNWLKIVLPTIAVVCLAVAIIGTFDDAREINSAPPVATSWSLAV